MNQIEKAERFAALHIQGVPLTLYNAWDAGSAKAIGATGAPAIGTSSWSVAEAQGYADGEQIPLGVVEQVVARIVATVELPVSVDFEGGYSDDEHQLAGNLTRLIEAGAIGVNFEDRIVKGEGLYDIDAQARRIAALRRAAERAGVPVFINARTDLFLGRAVGGTEAVLDEALSRARAYAAAGASGLFVPGLTDVRLIARICEGANLPVNVMVTEGLPSRAQLIELGVSRISFGPIPYLHAMRALEQEARRVFPAAAGPAGDSSKYLRLMAWWHDSNPTQWFTRW